MTCDIPNKLLCLNPATRAIEAVYDEERGYPPYHPRMMVKVLLYGYCTGTYSSRKIARQLVENVPMRFLAAGNQPDFRTVSDFRKRHGPALAINSGINPAHGVVSARMDVWIPRELGRGAGSLGSGPRADRPVAPVSRWSGKPRAFAIPAGPGGRRLVGLRVPVTPRG